jgi:hypothetical protein
MKNGASTSMATSASAAKTYLTTVRVSCAMSASWHDSTV